MTLENCRRLLKHFNDIADGTIPKPEGHKDWGDVIYNAKIRAAEMEKRIARKMNHPKYANVQSVQSVPEVKKEMTATTPGYPKDVKTGEKKNAKRSA